MLIICCGIYFSMAFHTYRQNVQPVLLVISRPMVVMLCRLAACLALPVRYMRKRSISCSSIDSHSRFVPSLCLLILVVFLLAFSPCFDNIRTLIIFLAKFSTSSCTPRFFLESEKTYFTIGLPAIFRCFVAIKVVNIKPC